MKHTFNIIYVAAAAAMLSACAEWTTPEALPFKVNTIEDTNPGLYAKYQAAIKEYKASEHHVTYVTFDNIYDTPLNAACKLTSLPDSVDFVELTNPGNVNDWTLADMKALREKFDTRFVMRVSYKEATEAAKIRYGNDYFDHIPEFVDSLLNIASKGNFDGITVEYEGMGTLHALDAEIELLKLQEEQIFPKVKAWMSANSGKLLFFEGNPQHTVDHSVVLAANHVILPTADMKSAQKVGYCAVQAVEYEEDGVAIFKDVKIILAARAIPDDITDTSTGRYFEGPSLELLTRWIMYEAPQNCSKAGLAIYNVQNDCLMSTSFYPNVRQAVKILNPNS